MMLSFAIVSSIDTLLHILVWLLILRAIMSWFRPDPTSSGGQMYYRLYAVLFELTEPLVSPIRRAMPGGGMGVDFSLLILLLILQFLRQLIWGLV